MERTRAAGDASAGGAARRRRRGSDCPPVEGEAAETQASMGPTGSRHAAGPLSLVALGGVGMPQLAAFCIGAPRKSRRICGPPQRIPYPPPRNEFGSRAVRGDSGRPICLLPSVLTGSVSFRQ
jgi:hypothetical protein